MDKLLRVAGAAFLAYLLLSLGYYAGTLKTAPVTGIKQHLPLQQQVGPWSCYETPVPAVAEAYCEVK